MILPQFYYIFSNSTLLFMLPILLAILPFLLSSAVNGLNYSLAQIILYKYEINSISFNHNGSLLLSAGNSYNLTILKMNNSCNLFQEIQTLVGHTANINYAKFNKNDSYIISASNDCTIKIWKYNKFQYVLLQTINTNSSIISIDISQDSSKIICGLINGSILIFSWNSTMYNQIQKLSQHIYCVNYLSFNHNGSLFASSSTDGTVIIWNLINNLYIRVQLLNFTNFNYVINVKFNSDSSKLFCSNVNKIIYIYHFNTTTTLYSSGQILACHEDQVSTLFLSLNDILISGSLDHNINIYQLQSNGSYSLINQLIENLDWVLDVSFDQNSMRVASGGSDSTIKIWQVLIDCTKISSSSGINLYPSECKCISEFIWNRYTQKCQYNCSIDQNSNGSNLNATYCYCNRNYYWNLTMLSCININPPPQLNFTMLSLVVYINASYNLILNTISFPNIKSLLQIFGPCLNFIDDFTYYMYHKIQYNSNLYQFFQVLLNLTNNKWIPSFIKNPFDFYLSKASYSPNILQNDYERTPPKFVKLGQDIYFLKNIQNYLISGVPLTTIIFFMFYLIYAICKYLKINKIRNYLIGFSSILFLFTSLIGQNLQYLSFRCFQQFYLLISTNNYFTIINLISMYLMLFFIIIYAVSFILLIRYYQKQLLSEFTQSLHPGLDTSIYVIIKLVLKIFCGFLHGYLYFSPYNQQIGLLSVQIINLVLIIYYRKRFVRKLTLLLIIFQYLMRICLHIFLLVELEFPNQSDQLPIILGELEITILISILVINFFQSINIFFKNFACQDQTQKNKEQTINQIKYEKTLKQEIISVYNVKKIIRVDSNIVITNFIEQE